MSDGNASGFAAELEVAVRETNSKRRPATPHCYETLEDLQRSDLTAHDALLMRIKDVSSEWCKEHVGQECRGYLIPYTGFDKKVIDDFYRVRHHIPPPSTFAGKTTTHDFERYMQPKGSGVRAYLPPCIDWQKILKDPKIKLCITEGEKKAYAMCKAGFPTIGLGGCWSFRNVGALLDALVQLAPSRSITICFDSDRVANKDIQLAEITLATLLRLAGARVSIATIPAHGDKKIGLDDLLIAQGKAAVAAVLQAAVEFTVRELVAGMRRTQKSNAERHRKVALAVVAELKIAGKFIRSDDGLLYFDGASKTLISLDAEKDRALRAFVDDRTSITAACQEWGGTYERLADTAHTTGERVAVYKLAHYDAKTGTWYRAQSESKLFRATAKGWTVVDNGSDGVLIHTRGQMVDVQVAERKAARAAFEAVVDVPNFVDGHTLTAKQARLLWSIYVISLNFPEALPTRPIPLFNGPKGSGKTSGGRAVLRTEYGPRGQVTAIDAKKFDALQAIVINNAITCVDNIDGKHEGLQNLLATVATGGMVELRTLYTTMGKSEYRIDCFLMATSRDPKSFTRDDVVDRLLYFLCERREDFQAESEMIAAIDENRPRYWRWLLDLMPSIIKALQKAKPGAVHDDRMADFAKFAVAVGPVLGYSAAAVTAALVAMNAEKLNFQSEHSSVLGAIGLYVANKVADVNMHGRAAKTDEEIEEFDALIEQLNEPMPAADLLDAIKTVHHDFGYTSAINFGQALRNEATAIETKFNFTASYNKNQKRWMYSVAPLGGYATREQIKQQFRAPKS